MNGKELFLATASFSSSKPRSEGLGETEFFRSTYVTFYFRTRKSESFTVRNQNGIEIRKEHYGFYITENLKDLGEPAKYDDQQYERRGAKEIPVRYSFEEGDP